MKKKDREKLTPEALYQIQQHKRSLAKIKTGKHLKVLPSITCDICPMGKELYGDDSPCKMYEVEAVCFYDEQRRKLQKTDERIHEKVKDRFDELINIYDARVFKAVTLENLQGGMLSKDTDRITKLYSELLVKRDQLENPQTNIPLSLHQTNIQSTQYGVEFMNEVNRVVMERQKKAKDGDVQGTDVVEA